MEGDVDGETDGAKLGAGVGLAVTQGSIALFDGHSSRGDQLSAEHLEVALVVQDEVVGFDVQHNHVLALEGTLAR